jgi:hypothetical protein
MLAYEDAPLDVAVPYRTVRCYTSPTVDVSGKKLTAATDTYFPDLKVMLLRDSENPKEGMFLAMKGGHNDESHNHNDVGSFVVYKNGLPVLIDAGVGEYTKQTFSPDRYKIWSMQSLYHNLPSFDGVGQHNGAQYKSKNEVYSKEERSLTLYITDAYPEECGLLSYSRSGSLKNGAVIITENIKLCEEKLIDFVYDDKTCEYLASKCVGGKRGARELRNSIRREIENKIVDIIVDNAEGSIKTISTTADNEIKIDFQLI